MSAHQTGRQANRTRSKAPSLRSSGIRMLVTGLFLLAELCRGGAALAQGSITDQFDLEPPLIEHEVVTQADASYRQRFFAQVVDDRELANVTLHWRYAGETNFAMVAMNRVSTSSTYIGEVSTSPTDSRSIEYFLEARDVSGNRTVRGFVFSPLVRSIVNAEVPAPPPATQAGATTDAPEASGSKTVYWVLGALAVGLLAGLASGSSSGGDGGNDECGSDGCEVVILFEPPVSP